MKTVSTMACGLLSVFITLLLCGTYDTRRIRYNWMHGTHHPTKPPVSLHSPCNLFQANYTASFTTIFQLHKNDTPLYYSYMTIIDGYLYVGAMNYLFKFNRTSISEAVNTLYGPPRPEPVQNCKEIGYVAIDEAVDCQNHFLYVTLNKTAAKMYKRRKTFYMCVSMSHDPEGWIVDADTLEVLDRTYSHVVHGMCPYNPLSNSTYLYVDQGNPGNKEAIYWASAIDQQGKTPLISRTELLNTDGSIISYRTKTATRQNDYYFDDAHFIKMFDMGEVVYTFFRNKKHPMEMLDNVMRSYVGRVCKSDHGDNFFKGLWTSYLQVQLQCKLPETIYSYDEIQDVVEIGDEFYAIFTSLSSDRPGSVMCRYSKPDLEKLFKTQTYMTRDGKKNVPEEIFQCQHSQDTRDYPIDRVNLNLQYYVIFGECIPVLQSFILFLPNVFLRELEVDATTIDSTLILYAGSNTGEIYQMYYPDRNDYEVYISAIFKPNHIREPVTEMLFDSEKRALFVGYASALVQLSVPADMCYMYRLADGCMYNPTCLWNVDTRKCVKSTSPQVVENHLTYKNLSFLWPPHRVLTKTVNYVRYYETVYETWTRMLKLDRTQPRRIELPLGSSKNFELDLSSILCHSGPLSWYHNGAEITYHPDSNYLIDTNYMLTLKRTATTSGGLYMALDQWDVVFTYVNVTVVPGPDPREVWTQKFKEWCDEFDKYKKKVNELSCEPVEKEP